MCKASLLNARFAKERNLGLDANARTVALQTSHHCAGLRPSVPTTRPNLTVRKISKALRGSLLQLRQVLDQAASVQFPRAASLSFTVPAVRRRLGQSRPGLRPSRRVRGCNPRAPWLACRYRAHVIGRRECGYRSSSFWREGAATLYRGLVVFKTSPCRARASRRQSRMQAHQFEQRPNKTFELTSSGALRSPTLAAQCWR